jgi:CHAD domain-containing protein
MLEEERKYLADPTFRLPDLTGALTEGGEVVAQPRVTLTATYYDTDDLRLARAGVSLRHRRGDAKPWTVKLPADHPGVRHEISRSGRAGTAPTALVALVAAWARGRTLRPATVVRTVRTAYDLRAADGTVLAEVADDEVSVLDGRDVRATFREIEVERKAGDRTLLDRVGDVLTEAGATIGDFIPKHVRALGAAATAPPDLTPPAHLPPKPSAGDVVTEAIRRGAERIFAHDPLVRLGAATHDDDTAVHQMRVGCRRLRSDLRTFAPLLAGDWVEHLREELRWFAGVLGGARDAEVLRERLHRTAATDPLSPPDPTAVAAIDAALVARHERALDEVAAAMRSARYFALLDALVDTARAPRLAPQAGQPATKLLPRLVARPWRRLAFGAKGVGGATDLDPTAPDGAWHAVRINGKKARYAVDAVATVIDGEAPGLAKALANVQTLLGDHQDAAVAAQTWVDIARQQPGDHALAVTAGRLFERERAAVREARAGFPKAWRSAAQARRTAWLP